HHAARRAAAAVGGRRQRRGPRRRQSGGIRTARRATHSAVAPVENGSGPGRGPLETAFLAGLGWASLTAETADDLADEIARLAGFDRDELRGIVRDVFAGWRRETANAGIRKDEMVERLIAKLRLVQRDETDDLALRVAQLEHRLRLLEADR